MAGLQTKYTSRQKELNRYFPPTDKPGNSLWDSNLGLFRRTNTRAREYFTWRFSVSANNWGWYYFSETEKPPQELAEDFHHTVPDWEN